MSQHTNHRPRYVLIIEENVHHAELLTETLDRHFAPVIIHTVDTFHDGMEFLARSTYDLILTAAFIGSESIQDVLKDLLALARGTPVIVITGKGDESLAAKLSRRGVAEYLVKTPETLERLPAIFRKQLEKALRLKTGPLPTPPPVRITKSQVSELQHEMYNLKKGLARAPSIPKLEHIEDLQKQLAKIRTMVADLTNK